MINCQNIWNINYIKFYQKLLKRESWKINNHPVNSRNCDSLSWILGAISLEPWFRKSQKFQKDLKSLKKLQVLIETWY